MGFLQFIYVYPHFWVRYFLLLLLVFLLVCCLLFLLFAIPFSYFQSVCLMFSFYSSLSPVSLFDFVFLLFLVSIICLLLFTFFFVSILFSLILIFFFNSGIVLCSLSLGFFNFFYLLLCFSSRPVFFSHYIFFRCCLSIPILRRFLRYFLCPCFHSHFRVFLSSSFLSANNFWFLLAHLFFPSLLSCFTSVSIFFQFIFLVYLSI